MTQSIFTSFSTHLKHAIKKSIEFAAEFGHEQIHPMHLLYGPAAEKGSLSSELLTKAEFPVDLLKQELIRTFHTPYLTKIKEPALSEDAIDILTKSIRTAQLYEHTYVGTEHALACLLNLANPRMNDLFRIWQIQINDLQHQLLVVLKSTSKFPNLTETLRDLQSQQEDLFEEMPEYPMLESLAAELTTGDALANAAPLIGREAELNRLQQVLGRRFKSNPLLIGHPGVGKTALVEGLANLIATGKAPAIFSGKKIFHLELSTLVAGTMYRGEFEQRLKALIEECKIHPEIILFIDEIHTLVGAGSTGQALDAANILKPALARGEIRCIGATTWEEYHKHFKTDGALNRRFELIGVDEPTKEQTFTILHGMKKQIEEFHEVKIDASAIDEAVQLSERYLSNRFWPDKAIDLLDEAAATKSIGRAIPSSVIQEKKLKTKLTKIQGQKQEALSQDLYKEALAYHEKIEKVLHQLQSITAKPIKKLKVSRNDIQENISRKLNLDAQMTRTHSTISDQLFDALSAEIYGQDDVLKKLTNHLQRSFSPLRDEKKPLGSFLLLGPSGVGKTETAKQLAKALFGSEKKLIKLDMSEYAESHSVSKLLGSPAGYIGHENSGLLTSALSESSNAVLLFDEVEKAHPDLFNLLLQILDDGVLRDASGRQVDFSNTVILLTSNLGNSELSKQVGFDSEHDQSVLQMEKQYKAILENFFRKELLNRLDEILYYQPLGIQARQAIIKKGLEKLSSKMVNFSFELDDRLLAKIAEEEYDKSQGVRSLEQFLKKQIEIPLSKELRQSSLKKERTFTLELVDGNYSIT